MIQTKTAFSMEPTVENVFRRDAINALKRFGFRTRQAAMSSMKFRKKPAPPGEPPSAHKGTIKNLVLYDVDENTLSVIVGPKLFAPATGAPRIQEFGDTVTHPNSRRTLRTLGRPGEIRILGNDRASRRIVRRYRKAGATPKWLSQVKGSKLYAAYAKLKTPAQVRRANELNAQLYGPDDVTATVAARPYMKPAADANLKRLPAIWGASGN